MLNNCSTIVEQLLNICSTNVEQLREIVEQRRMFGRIARPCSQTGNNLNGAIAERSSVPRTVPEPHPGSHSNPIRVQVSGAQATLSQADSVTRADLAGRTLVAGRRGAVRCGQMP